MVLVLNWLFSLTMVILIIDDGIDDFCLYNSLLLFETVFKVIQLALHEDGLRLRHVVQALNLLLKGLVLGVQGFDLELGQVDLLLVLLFSEGAFRSEFIGLVHCVHLRIMDFLFQLVDVNVKVVDFVVLFLEFSLELV